MEPSISDRNLMAFMMDQVQGELKAERAVRQAVENELEQKTLSQARLSAELEKLSTVVQAMEGSQSRLLHCEAEKHELQASIDRLSREVIDVALKLEAEKKRNVQLRQSDQQQNSANMVRHHVQSSC